MLGEARARVRPGVEAVGPGEDNERAPRDRGAAQEPDLVPASPCVGRRTDGDRDLRRASYPAPGDRLREPLGIGSQGQGGECATRTTLEPGGEFGVVLLRTRVPA